MLNFEYKASYDFSDLVKLMVVLREECPWDREQTHESIRQSLIEETYEACEAIDLGDRELLLEELGDVLLQVVFHARIEEEKGSFNIDDVADGVCKKLIHRHPHIFGDLKADTADEVLAEWERIKREDKGGSYRKSVSSVARSLPSLIRAEKMQSRAAKSGFHLRDAWDDLAEEIEECRAATGRASKVDEVGDLLFAAVSVARSEGVDPERALELSCDKFARRFAYVESVGGDLTALTPEQQEKLWEEAKDEGL